MQQRLKTLSLAGLYFTCLTPVAVGACTKGTNMMSDSSGVGVLIGFFVVTLTFYLVIVSIVFAWRLVAHPMTLRQVKPKQQSEGFESDKET